MTDAERQDMTCATCVWSKPMDTDAKKAVEQSTAGSREQVDAALVCRRFPPELRPDSPWGAFPAVLRTWWCGEWRK